LLHHEIYTVKTSYLKEALVPAMSAHVINYLKLSGVEVGYLFNFYGSRVEWKRFVNGGG
jgi:hypothetical protein